jgi:hypothetical protein
MIELARQIALTIESPIWEKVRRPSPWAKTMTTPNRKSESSKKTETVIDADALNEAARSA